MDTQWPRWEVFEQEKPGAPYRSTGSVHAPDAEMALENARDVFARRPRCAGLWVTQAAALFSRTAEELAGDRPAPEAAGGDPQPYLVFQKQTQRATETFVTHVGEVTATSPQAALARALETFSSADVFVWWVCPAAAVTRSAEADVEPMFVPAESKPYRHPQFYKVMTQLRDIKSRTGESS